MPVATIPPGVSVQEITSPSVNTFIAPESDLCLVGVAGNVTDATYTPIQVTEQMILAGTAPQTLQTLALLNNDAVLVGVQTVQNLLNPTSAGYAEGVDYTVQAGEGPPDGSGGTITRLNTGNIPDGTPVSVTYTYTPTDYFQPVRLFDIASVESRFGSSWQTRVSNFTGQVYNVGINSQLSMAARMAFSNGAQSVILQPLFARQTPGNPSTPAVPVATGSTQIADSATWSDTLQSLRTLGNISMIVPVVGQDGTLTDSDMQSIFTTFQSHLSYMNSLQQYVIAIFGEDGTVEGTGSIGPNGTATGLINTVRTHAANLQGQFGNNLSSQCVLVNNTKFQLPVPGLNATIDVGGQYAAAAVGGALAARTPSQGLTRQPILGFQSISDPRTVADKNIDAGHGLLVLEQVNVGGAPGVIRVRQGITLDIQNGPPKAEISVVRAKFAMMETIRETLDSQIIGNIIADANSPVVVRSAISAILSLLQQQGVIVGYNAVSASLTSLNPTTIVASFSYQPAFPLNFINVTFTLDLSAGNIIGLATEV